MKNIINIFKSEFKTIFTDPGTILIMVLAVFLYGIFYMIPFLKQVLKEIPIGVVDFDNSSMSREMTRNLDSNEYIQVVSRPRDLEEAKLQYYENKIRAYVLIPKDFERDIKRGGSSYVSAYEDSAFLIIYKQVATGIFSTTTETGARIEIAKFMKYGLSKKQAITARLPFDFVQMPLFNPFGSYQNYIYPIILLLILQQTMLIGTGLLAGLIKEKFKGIKLWTKDGKLVEEKITHVSEFSDNPIEIVLGKSLAYVLLYLIYALLFILVFPAIVVYNMTYNILLMLLLLIPFLFSVSFLGQASVYFYTERESSLLLLVVTSVPMIFLPGFVYPKEVMPFWLIAFSKFIPATSAIEGLTRVNQFGANFSQVAENFWVLIGLCILYFALACLVYKKLNDGKL